VRPPEPRGEPAEPPSLHSLAPEPTEEAPWPDEARAELIADESAATMPLEATAGQQLHVHFRGAPQERMLQALEGLREVLRGRPGETAVVLHIPAGGGRAQEMQLRSGVAYDAELLAAVRRRLGEGLVELTLHSAG
jgi:hypothetical protein